MILVVGDFMVDEYVHVAIDRISPEAPVPVMRELRREVKPGGAGNVAANIHTLGEKVRLLTVVGELDARWWNPLVAQCPWVGWIQDQLRDTTVKTRFVADRGQQVARLDRETTTDIRHLTLDRLKDSIKQQLNGVKVIVISDYQKGVVTDNLARWLIDGARELKIPVIVDSKCTDTSRFDGATIWTPNEHEYREARVIPDVMFSVVTMGSKGIKIYKKSENVVIPAIDRQDVADVTGAGDTVVAALAVWFAERGTTDIEGAVGFANHAASIAVSKRGTYAVTREEIGV